MSTKPDAEVETGTSDEDEDELLDLSRATVEALSSAGDVEGLVALARAARAGSHGRTKDMKVAFEAYRAAGDAGHAESDFAAALFCMTGTGTTKDLKEAASRLRRAADAGHVDAKVTLGNFYDLGLHFAKDGEKADVWYRSAARAAKIEHPMGSTEATRALAALGSTRHTELLAAVPNVDPDELTAARKRARLRGGSLQGPAEPAATTRGPSDATKAEDTSAPLEVARPSTEDATKKKLATLEKDAKLPSKVTARAGAGAFLYALLFTATAFGAAFAAEAGARELVAHGKPIPVVGARIELVFPLLFGAISLLPQLLVYKAVTVVRSTVVAALGFGAGWVLYGTGKLAIGDARLSQAIAFAGAAFLTSLLLQGLLGGAKGGDPIVSKVPRRQGK
jgi:hypothetical protein